MTVIAMITRPASLETLLCCPKCGGLVNRHGAALNPEVFLGALQCDRRFQGETCGAKWWATRLDAGSIREQLLAVFEDPELVAELMSAFALPEAIPHPRFWQIRLDGQQWHRYTRNEAPGMRGRSIALLRGVISHLKRAS